MEASPEAPRAPLISGRRKRKVRIRLADGMPPSYLLESLGVARQGRIAKWGNDSTVGACVPLPESHWENFEGLGQEKKGLRNMGIRPRAREIRQSPTVTTLPNLTLARLLLKRGWPDAQAQAFYARERGKMQR